MNRQHERLFECPVCAVEVTSCHLHEHYATHFRNERSSESIKAANASVSSFVNASSTSTEIQKEQQQQQQQQQETINDNVETQSNG